MHTVSSCGGGGCQVQDCDGLPGIQSVCKGMSAKGAVFIPSCSTVGHR